MEAALVPVPLCLRGVRHGKDASQRQHYGVALGREGSFFAFAGLQISLVPLSTSQDQSQVAGAAGLTPKRRFRVPVSLLLPIAGSGTTK